MQHEPTTCTAFIGARQVASGPLEEVVRAALAAVGAGADAAREGHGTERLALFLDETGAPFDIDRRGTPDEVVERLRWHPLVGRRPARKDTDQGTDQAIGQALDEAVDQAPAERRGPGRPRLGVVSREVSLLPRHWDWLAGQRGGASATLRRLVDAARRESEGPDRARRARDAAYRVMAELAGDRPGFEDACRALYAGNWEAFDRATASWPPDVRAYAARMAAPARG